jgi:hypothetical protein
MQVLESICEVIGELASTGISKDRRNQQQGYQFRGIDDVYNALSPLLAKHKLAILPSILDRTCEARETQKGGILYSVCVTVEYRIMSARDGSEISVRTMGEAMDSGDKATNKALSAAYKYMALQTFAIPTEGDNDADAHTPPETVRRIEPPSNDDAIVTAILEGLGAATDLATIDADLKKSARFLHGLQSRNPRLYEKVRSATHSARVAIQAHEALT